MREYYFDEKPEVLHRIHLVALFDYYVSTLLASLRQNSIALFVMLGKTFLGVD